MGPLYHLCVSVSERIKKNVCELATSVRELRMQNLARDKRAHLRVNRRKGFYGLCLVIGGICVLKRFPQSYTLHTRLIDINSMEREEKKNYMLRIKERI